MGWSCASVSVMAFAPSSLSMLSKKGKVSVVAGRRSSCHGSAFMFKLLFQEVDVEATIYEVGVLQYFELLKGQVTQRAVSCHELTVDRLNVVLEGGVSGKQALAEDAFEGF